MSKIVECIAFIFTNFDSKNIEVGKMIDKAYSKFFRRKR